MSNLRNTPIYKIIFWVKEFLTSRTSYSGAQSSSGFPFPSILPNSIEIEI